MDHWLTSHVAYASLTSSAKVVLHNLMARFNGKNNGEIVAPQEHIATATHMHRNTVNKALKLLVERGFVVVVSEGYLGLDGSSKSARYRLTMYPANGKTATMDFTRTI